MKNPQSPPLFPAEEVENTQEKKKIEKFCFKIKQESFNTRQKINYFTPSLRKIATWLK